ncbi:MAG: MYXO-CTERM sorting domain-containing protein [Planctomycetota bacterium]|jgi:MYXO-CTERM domain-containing protein
MRSNRFNVFTLSVALAGLAVCLLSPAAYGHGNNPPLPDDSKISAGSPPAGPFTPIRPNTDAEPPNDTADSLGPTWGPMNGPPDPPGFGLGSLILSGGTPIDPVGNDLAGFGTVGILPGADLDFGSAPPVQRVSSGGAIPTPGTLALLGLAALATKRRRRR